MAVRVCKIAPAPRVIRPPCFPSAARFPSRHSRSSLSTQRTPGRETRSRPFTLSFAPFLTIPRFSILRRPLRHHRPSACPSPVRKIFLPPFNSRDHLRRPPPSPVPSLDHPDLPFLSLDHSDRSRNKCHPHLPRFPFSSVTSMIILRPAINREKGEGLAIGCRFDPAFMEGSICLLDLDSTLVILDGSKSSLSLSISRNKKMGRSICDLCALLFFFIRRRG